MRFALAILTTTFLWSCLLGGNHPGLLGSAELAGESSGLDNSAGDTKTNKSALRTRNRENSKETLRDKITDALPQEELQQSESNRILLSKRMKRCVNWCVENKNKNKRRCRKKCRIKFKGRPWHDTSSDGLFSVNLQPFKTTDAKGYNNCNDLKKDITQALRMLANAIIRQNEDIVVNDTPATSRPRPLSSQQKEESSGEDSFGTNNQETGVDEGDIVKSNGESVVAGYGDVLIHWNATTGEILSRTYMTIPEDSRRELSILYPYRYPVRPQIKDLLLYEDRVVVIVGWYSYDTNGIFYGQANLQLKVYDLSGAHSGERVGELPLLAQHHMQGRYIASRSILSIGHVVTMSDFNFYDHFSRHLQRWQPQYNNLDKRGYRKAAMAKALELIPRVLKLIDEQLHFNGKCKKFAKISTLTYGGTNSLRPEFYSNGVLNSFVKVTSFDIAGDFGRNKQLKTKSTYAFVPTRYVQVYASPDAIVVAGRGWMQRLGDWRNWKEQTYLYVFELQGDGRAAKGVGGAHIDGYLLNQFAMDYHDGYLRVASTSSAQWKCLPPPPDSETTTTSQPCIWQIANDSSSQISILDFRKPAAGGSNTFGKQVGFLGGLGLGERIFAVRFFADRAFVVTFRQIDPLYSVSLKDPTNPVVMGELKLPGFSNYLHPIGNNMILGVGQDADPETGRQTGFQISLFDTADLANIRVLKQYKVEEKYSYSDAQGDHHSFRFLPMTKVLIVPLQIYRQGKNDNFDGFNTYYVDVGGIKPLFNISHVEPNLIRNWGSWCWYNAHMPSRSLVHKGKLTTMKSHSVQTHDIATEKHLWSINLDDGLPEDDCVGYWG